MTINRSQLGKTIMPNTTKNKKRAGYQNGKLVGGQKILDKNKDGKISGPDFAMMKAKGGRISKMGGGMLKKAKPMNKGGRVNKMAGGMMKTSKKAK